MITGLAMYIKMLYLTTKVQINISAMTNYYSNVLEALLIVEIEQVSSKKYILHCLAEVDHTNSYNFN